MQIDSTLEYLTSQQISHTFESRFQEKVFIMTEAKGCWLWMGSIRKDGYGQMFRGKDRTTPIPAPRASWIIHRGPIPDGLWVLHECDVRSCVNPDHLFLGTRQDNIDDMVRKGRHVVGDHRGENGTNKLTGEQVLEIRAIKSFPRGYQAGAAKRYGVTKTCIWCVLNRRTWTHI